MVQKKKSRSNNLIDAQKIARVKNLANQYDCEILKVLGFYKVGRWGVQCECPIHGGDNPSAFSYNAGKHVWSCFSQHCEQDFGNDIIGLVKGMKGCTFAKAIKWLEDVLNKNDNIDWKEIDQQIENEQFSYINTKTTNTIISENKLGNLIKDFSLLEDRNLEKKTLELFQGGLCKPKKEPWNHRFMIPIRNDGSQIVGFTGRSIYGKCKKCGLYHDGEICPNQYCKLYSKWLNYPTNFNKAIELYNIDRAKDEIYTTNTAIITEGPFDVWKQWERGTKNVVATLGTSLSPQQCRLLAKHGCLNAIILYDSDNAGRKATKIILESTKEYFRVYTPNLSLKDGIDPGSIGESDYNSFIKPIIDKVIKV